MRTIFFALILLSQTGLAADTYGLECRSSDMTVQITNSGFTTLINGEKFSSEPLLSDAIAASPNVSFADLSIVAVNRPITVGSEVKILGCRTSYVQIFDQTFHIIDNKSQQVVLTKQFICESQRTQVENSLDCSKY